MKRFAGQCRSKSGKGRSTGRERADGSAWLLIDGQPVECPTWLEHKYLRFRNLTDAKPVPCGEGFYVLGDDLKDSDDSRFNGPVPANRVFGRAWLIVWPWKRLGWVR